MAVLQAVLALITRQAGRILNTVFGWATMLLFGKVPQDKQLLLPFHVFRPAAALGGPSRGRFPF